MRNQLKEEAYKYRQAFSDYHAIVQRTMDGEIVEVWKNAHTAWRGTKISGIRQAVLGLRESAGGYKWEFYIQGEQDKACEI